MSNPLQSTTTQNVAASGLTIAGGTAATLALIRSIAPDALPWDLKGDAAIVAFAAAMLQTLINALAPVVGQALEYNVRRAALDAASRETDNAVE
jgi:hypothetical protein